MSAWAAFTSDDLPMPRAPHSSALLAGRPSAKRSVFSIRMSRIRSMPLSRSISTRLTRGAALKRPFGCQTKASASVKEGALAAAGEDATWCAAIASSARAIRSGVSVTGFPLRRFAATFGWVREAGLAGERDGVLTGFFDMLQVPDAAAISGRAAGRKPRRMRGWITLQLGPRPLYSAPNSPYLRRRPNGGLPVIPEDQPTC